MAGHSTRHKVKCKVRPASADMRMQICPQICANTKALNVRIRDFNLIRRGLDANETYLKRHNFKGD